MLMLGPALKSIEWIAVSISVKTLLLTVYYFLKPIGEITSEQLLGALEKGNN